MVEFPRTYAKVHTVGAIHELPLRENKGFGYCLRKSCFLVIRALTQEAYIHIHNGPKVVRDFQIKKCSKTEAKTLSISSLCVLCAAVAHGGNPQDRAALSLWFVSWNNLFLGSP